MSSLSFDLAHLLAGSMLVLSFMLLYQDRITAVLNVFALQAIALSLSVAWQSVAQNAPHLVITAAGVEWFNAQPKQAPLAIQERLKLT